MRWEMKVVGRNLFFGANSTYFSRSEQVTGKDPELCLRGLREHPMCVRLVQAFGKKVCFGF
jgi:hypothetical protein